MISVWSEGGVAELCPYNRYHKILVWFICKTFLHLWNFNLRSSAIDHVAGEFLRSMNEQMFFHRLSATIHTCPLCELHGVKTIQLRFASRRDKFRAFIRVRTSSSSFFSSKMYVCILIPVAKSGSMEETLFVHFIPNIKYFFVRADKEC